MAVEGEFVPVSGRKYLLAGSLMITLAYLMGFLSNLFGYFCYVFSFIVTGVGLILYLLGLYLWRVDVDSRPLKLFLLEASLFIVAIFLLSWVPMRILLSPSWGFYRMLNYFALAYPFLVASALVYRFRMGLFTKSTGELNFNLAGNLYIIGTFLIPVLIGGIIMFFARIAETYSYWKLPMTARKNAPFNFSRRKSLALITASLVVSFILASVPFGSYDYSARSGNVAVYEKNSGSGTTLDIIIAIPDDFCGANVYVDGHKVRQDYRIISFWGPMQYLFVTQGKTVIKYHLKLSKHPRNVTVRICQGWNATWKNVVFKLPAKK
ncbi:MAG: DUF996 domain-containing protein [Thermococci archaeon]|nr:DUF996 domain-containing protein [Thermococci archaeon]